MKTENYQMIIFYEVFCLDLKLINEKPNELEFTIKGERHTIPNLLRNELLKDSAVIFAAYSLHHPFDKDSSFIVKTKNKSAKKALQDAVKSLDKQFSDFKKLVSKAL